MNMNDNCTIYNKYDNQWYKTHLYGVSWQDVTGVSFVKTAFKTEDNLCLYIPFKVRVGKKYKSPKEYDGNGWTIQKGDIVVKGIVEDDIKSITELNAKYDDVRTITHIDTLDYGSTNMRHWEVSAK